LLAAVALLLAARGVAQFDENPTAARTLAAGTWGGEHIRMDVDRNGAEVEFDCARGRILEPLRLDAKKRFRVKGTYKQDTPAPVQADGASEANAIYVGKVDGSKLRLEISVNGVDGIKSFELAFGQTGSIAKCA